MKLSEIKAELKKMLLQFNVVKTDKGILEYEGEEIKEGLVVKITNEDGTTEIPTGEYQTEDFKKLIIENGEIKAIEEIEVEPVEIVEPEQEEQPIEEPVVEPEEEPIVEPTEPEQEEQPIEEPAVEPEDKTAELETKIAELEAQLAEALKKIEELLASNEAILSKMEKFSLAKPAAEEFEQVKVTKKTGNNKLDKFLERING